MIAPALLASRKTPAMVLMTRPARSCSGYLAAQVADQDTVAIGYKPNLVPVPTKNPGFSVIPAQAGIQCVSMDSRLRGNDGTVYSSCIVGSSGPP